MSQGKNLSIRDAVAAVADGVAERLARAEDGAAAHEPEAVIRKSFKSQTVLIELALPQAALLGFHFLIGKTVMLYLLEGLH